MPMTESLIEFRSLLEEEEKVAIEKAGKFKGRWFQAQEKVRRPTLGRIAGATYEENSPTSYVMGHI